MAERKLVGTNEMFKKALAGGYAIGAYNVNNMEILQGIAEAAEETQSPIILQVSAGARKYANQTYLIKLVEAALATTTVPIALHLDHGADFEICKACIDGGFSSVMIDGSRFSFEENVEVTKKVVEYAHERGVSVEAELGKLAGVEDDVNVDAKDAKYTNVQEAVEFVKQTGCDSLAIAIGTSHGAYKFKGKAELRFDILEEIESMENSSQEESDILYTGEGEKAPTCTVDGIGHTECTKCQEPMQTNVTVEASGHTGGTATCKNKAECSVCHEGYGELDKNNHAGETEVKNAKKATCAADGYTGDTYCKDCGAKIATGTKIAKTTNHAWDGGVITKQPTAIEKGEKTYTCKVCKATKKEAIAALGAPKKGAVAKSGKATYKVTKSDLKNGTAAYVGPLDKKATKVKIPATVKIDGVTFKVTSIEKNAFKNNKKVKTVTIGKNVSKIGAKAFYGCSKLKTLKIKTTKLTAKKIGSKAFSKTPKSMKVTIPKKKFKTYKSMLIKKGVNKKAKLKKG